MCINNDNTTIANNNNNKNNYNKPPAISCATACKDSMQRYAHIT